MVVQRSEDNEEKGGKEVNRHEDVQNLGFIVKGDGMTIFHCGDARADIEEFKRFDFDKQTIDVAFMHVRFFFDKVGIEIIKKVIRLKLPTRKVTKEAQNEPISGQSDTEVRYKKSISTTLFRG